jgi:hypothetical protein
LEFSLESPGAQGAAARRERNGNMLRDPAALFPPVNDVRLQQIELGRLPPKIAGTSAIAQSGVIV